MTVAPPRFPARDAALSYASCGWPVVALRPDGTAHPAPPTTDPDAIVRTWATWPDADVGVALGAGARSLCALEVDVGAAANEWFLDRDVGGKIGHGHQVARDGARWLFAAVDPIADRELAPGVRLRGAGVLAMPPTAPWQWRRGQHDPARPLSLLPHWLRAAQRWAADPPGGPAIPISDDWTRELARRPDGAPQRTLATVCTVLRSDDRYAGALGFDESRRIPVLRRAPMSDGDVGRIREDLERRHRLPVGDELLRAAVLTVAEERPYHPVRDYLRGLRWDGVARLGDVHRDVLGGAADDALGARMVRAWFIGAAARALRPGCKCDTALVLVGPQGAMKSTFFATLGGPFFSDDAVDPSAKDALLQLGRFWILEWSEIEHVTSRRQAGEIKAFLSKRSDAFRPPYGRALVEVPRACVLVGTTNEPRFLEDPTGSRRFWCVRTGRIDVARLAATRDLLWAEAVAAFDLGEPWWLTTEQDVARDVGAEVFTVEDPWTAPLRRWAAKSEAVAGRTSEEILSDCLGVLRRDQTKASAMRLAAVLRGIGWEHRKARLSREGTKTPPLWAWFAPGIPTPNEEPDGDPDDDTPE